MMSNASKIEQAGEVLVRIEALRKEFDELMCEAWAVDGDKFDADTSGLLWELERTVNHLAAQIMQRMGVE